ncbi:MAG: hypothetical protein CVT48_05175, partial [Thermoplasmata archaeon HGW-Thermoplasmata-1]
MASFCPKCRGLLIPGKSGTLVCVKCGGAEKRGSSSLGDFLPSDHDDKRAGARRGEKITLKPIRPGCDGSLSGYFPYPQMREGQREFVSDWSHSLGEGGILLAYAPTGIGKTAAALAPAVEYAKASGKTVCFLTSKQSQHHVAIETLRLMVGRCAKPIGVVDMINKQDMCPLPEARELFSKRFLEFCAARQKRRSCEFGSGADSGVLKDMRESLLHNEELVGYCEDHLLCPHKAGLEAAKGADVIICDYNYFFSDLSERMLEHLDKELGDIVLVVDEAHNLPDRVRSNYTDRLTVNMLKEAKAEANKHRDAAAAHHADAVIDALRELVDGGSPQDERSVGGIQLVRGIERFSNVQRLDRVDYKEIVSRLANLGDTVLSQGADYSYSYECARFLQAWVNDENPNGSVARTVRSDGDENVILSYFLMDPSPMCAPVFRNVHSAIVMSGTLYPMEMYRDILGIPKDRCLMREYASPFPKENRLTLVAKGFSTAYKSRSEESYRAMAVEIQRIAASVPGNVACFFPSYKLMEEIGGFVDTSKKLIREDRSMGKEQKQAIYRELVELKNSGSGGLLLGVQGGSLSEGVDYKDNLLSVVVIVGLPLAPPSLDVELTINHFERTYGKAKGKDYAYVYPAMNKVLQAAGRLIRSETDRGVIVLMDERFAW